MALKEICRLVAQVRLTKRQTDILLGKIGQRFGWLRFHAFDDRDVKLRCFCGKFVSKSVKMLLRDRPLNSCGCFKKAFACDGLGDRTEKLWY